MITVRSIDRSEFSRVLSFYQETEYKGGLTESDQVVIAERHGKLLAAVRLCEEAGEIEEASRTTNTPVPGSRLAPLAQLLSRDSGTAKTLFEPEIRECT